MVDFSHANSRKQHKLQVDVARDVPPSSPDGGGRGPHHRRDGRVPPQGRPPGPEARASSKYGKSITDACIGWEDSLTVLDVLAR
jgi:3-deoxy-7-phosphoheptulonate synthase